MKKEVIKERLQIAIKSKSSIKVMIETNNKECLFGNIITFNDEMVSLEIGGKEKNINICNIVNCENFAVERRNRVVKKDEMLEKLLKK